MDSNQGRTTLTVLQTGLHPVRDLRLYRRQGRPPREYPAKDWTRPGKTVDARTSSRPHTRRCRVAVNGCSHTGTQDSSDGLRRGGGPFASLFWDTAVVTATVSTTPMTGVSGYRRPVSCSRCPLRRRRPLDRVRRTGSTSSRTWRPRDRASTFNGLQERLCDLALVVHTGPRRSHRQLVRRRSQRANVGWRSRSAAACSMAMGPNSASGAQADRAGEDVSYRERPWGLAGSGSSGSH